MGHNIDLVDLLALPKKWKCDKCNSYINTNFEDYDIDCGNPEASKNEGFLTLDIYCEDCDERTEIKVRSEVVNVK